MNRNLRLQALQHFPQFSSSNSESLYTAILANLIKNPSSVDISLSRWITTKPTCPDSQIASSEDHQGLCLEFYGNADIISLHWKFECLQMMYVLLFVPWFNQIQHRPKAASGFIYKNVIAPMAAINEIMQAREAKVLKMLDEYRKQADTIAQLYKFEMKREAVKSTADIDFDEEQFKTWKGVDWRKYVSVKYPSELLEKMSVYGIEMKKIEMLEAEAERKKAAQASLKTTSYSSGNAATAAAAALSAASDLELKELRRLKREADLEKAKAKSKKKKMF